MNINFLYYIKLFDILYRLSKLNHLKADILTKANETMWHPENGFNVNAKSHSLPWKVFGETVDDSVIMTFSLKKQNLGKHCPVTNSGMTVQFYFY